MSADVGVSETSVADSEAGNNDFVKRYYRLRRVIVQGFGSSQLSGRSLVLVENHANVTLTQPLFPLPFTQRDLRRSS